MVDEKTVGREPITIVELEQDQCRLIYGKAPCLAILGTTGQRKCFNTRSTCQDPDNYDTRPGVKDTVTVARNAASPSVAYFDPVEASKDVSGEETTPQGIFFKPDGKVLYVAGSDSDKVHEYSLTTAWDIATAGGVGDAFGDGSTNLTGGLFWKPDGTKLYICGISFGGVEQIRQHVVSTPWDLTTVAVTPEAVLVVSGEDTNPQGVFFKPDGTKVYVIGNVSDKIHQYPLSTAWDIATAGAVEATFDISGEDTSPTDLFFNEDGTRLYVVGTSSDKIHQYALTIAWDISTTGGVEASFSVAGEDTLPRGVFLKPDDTKLYIVGSTNDRVRQYPLAITSSGEEASFDVSSEDTVPNGVFLKSDGTKLYMIGDSSDKVHQYPLTTAWDISTAGVVEASFDVSGEEATPQGLFFKSDGTKLYIVGFTSDKVHQYPLTTAWDISTVGAVEASFDVSAEDTVPRDVAFKDDGTKMYIVGDNTNKLYQYPLTTAWDISTTGGTEASFSILEFGAPHDVFFKIDGTKLFIIGFQKIFQYPLTTAWDISTTGSEEGSKDTTGEDSAGRGLYLKSDGTRLYFAGDNNDTIYQYFLDIAWDVTSAGSGIALLDGVIDGALHVDAHTPGFGQALSFDGVDDSIEIVDEKNLLSFSGLVKFTVEVIMTPKDVTSTTVVEKTFTDVNGVQGWNCILSAGGNFVFQRFLDGVADSVSSSAVVDETHIWTVVYDGTDMILYEDSIERDRTASSKSLLENGQSLFVGNDAVGGTATPFSGTIDDLRIWSDVRIVAEIRERAVLPLSGLEPNIVGYWPLDNDPPLIAIRTLRFTKPQHFLPLESINLWKSPPIPLLANVSTAPTKLNPGGFSRDRGVLGDRSMIDATFRDAPGSDRIVDKYRLERISGAAQLDEGGYEPLDRGAFWAKWKTRNLFYQNRRLRVLEGYLGQSLANMQKREYFIDSLSGPDADGMVKIRAKDVLKLASDERAQVPTLTVGELKAALTDTETTKFTATGALIADYPDEPGLVRIGDEVIQYTTRIQVTANEVEFSVLTRGVRGTTAASHDEDDRVQRCIDFVNVLPWKLAEDLLVNFGNVPKEFIPITEWDAEGQVWLIQFTVSALITEPKSVLELLSEITEQVQFFLWWDEYSQTVKLRALRPPTEEVTVLDDTSHIIAGTSVLTEDSDSRITQVWVFFEQRDPTKNLDDEGNWARVRIRADLEAEGDAQYGEKRIKKIFSRWLETESQVIQVTKRTLDRFRDNPRTLRLRVDAKDRSVFRVGDLIDVVTRTVLDDRGLASTTLYQVVSTRENPTGEAVEIELLNFASFAARNALYMESTAPDFDNATTEEKRLGAWYSLDNGKMPDGSDGYVYI